MRLQVMKFGGTSVGDADCISRAAKIIISATRESSVIAVVSAVSGVTNRLIAAAERAATGDENASIEIKATLTEQHTAALNVLIKDEAARSQLATELKQIIEEVEARCRGTALLRELTPRTLAMISSAGERLSARLLAAALQESGIQAVAIDATELIVTEADFAQADPLMTETRERATARLLPLIRDGLVPVVTGFIGATLEGVLTTLGRGGSDYSATILGSALSADEIIIWTDVDGVLTADPRLVPTARLLQEISYSEAAELAYFGAKVLHPKTLQPVADAGIPVSIRNSFAPEKAGTKITRTGHSSEAGVRAITAIKNVSLITVGGRGIVGVIGVAAKTFTAAASVRANVLLISQSSIRVTPEICIIAAVGERMHGTPGIAGRLFSSLGKKGVNIIAIAQGSSEYNVSFVVEESEMQSAMIAIHEEFELGRRSFK